MSKDRPFMQMLEERQRKAKTFLCVGLDPDPDKIPPVLFQKYGNNVGRIFSTFLERIVEATARYACVFKPNIAFYEAYDIVEGTRILRSLISYINTNYPDIPVILDAKKADIGNTNKPTCQLLEELGVDGVTLNPYLGREALEPFLNLTDLGKILLCRTSNSGAGEFQNLMTTNHHGVERPLYQQVAWNITYEWDAGPNCMLVFGATAPEELALGRELVGDNMSLFIPGLGAQGGEAEATVKAALNSAGAGFAINSSRGIIHASQYDNFDEIAAWKALETRDQINFYR